MTSEWIRDNRRWWTLVSAILLTGALWTWYSRVPEADAGTGRIPSPREGFAAPEFSLESLGGEQVSLSSLRGQVVIVNLWASWCVPCRIEMPAIQQVYAANRERGLMVLGVNSTVQDSEEAARTFAQQMGVTFPILLDRDGAVSRRYLLRALPTTFFIDRRGVIRAVIVGGPISEATLQSKVETLLDEVP